MSTATLALQDTTEGFPGAHDASGVLASPTVECPPSPAGAGLSQDGRLRTGQCAVLGARVAPSAVTWRNCLGSCELLAGEAKEGWGDGR